MTVRELKDFIQDCRDTDYVTMCSCREDNPTTEFCDIEKVFKIKINDEDVTQTCFMPL